MEFLISKLHGFPRLWVGLGLGSLFLASLWLQEPLWWSGLLLTGALIILLSSNPRALKALLPLVGLLFLFQLVLVEAYRKPFIDWLNGEQISWAIFGNLLRQLARLVVPLALLGSMAKRTDAVVVPRIGALLLLPLRPLGLPWEKSLLFLFLSVRFLPLLRREAERLHQALKLFRRNNPKEKFGLRRRVAEGALLLQTLVARTIVLAVHLGESLALRRLPPPSLARESTSLFWLLIWLVVGAVLFLLNQYFLLWLWGGESIWFILSYHAWRKMEVDAGRVAFSV